MDERKSQRHEQANWYFARQNNAGPIIRKINLQRWWRRRIVSTIYEWWYFEDRISFRLKLDLKKLDFKSKLFSLVVSVVALMEFDANDQAREVCPFESGHLSRLESNLRAHATL